jgi:hypothetical protein
MRITAAAVQCRATGRIWTGLNHGLAREIARPLIGLDDGFVDEDGEFLTRAEAYVVAGIFESEDLT